jgi:hypothetical protein
MYEDDDVELYGKTAGDLRLDAEMRVSQDHRGSAMEGLQYHLELNKRMPSTDTWQRRPT